VVVGAGIGGLACAIDLAARGANVTVLERAAYSGGKARVVPVGAGPGVDGGPTVFTMPWVFDELWAAAGRDFRQALPLERAEVLARHYWLDGAELDLFDDPERSADAIGRLCGPRDARAFREFGRDTKRIYEISEAAFLKSQRLTIPGIVKRFGPAGLATLATLDSHRTMAQALEKRFTDPRLRQLFGRYATYCGSSPYEAPATLNLIAHVEAQGVYRARGGMGALVRALEDLARALGVELRHGVHVDHILVAGGRAQGVETAEGRVPGEVVVFNGEVSALSRRLLGGEVVRSAPATPRDTRSLSAVTWAMEARADGRDLVHHNVVFSDDYRQEFDELLRRGRVPAVPTVYICAQDRSDGSGDGNPSPERFLVLVNAPPTGDEPTRWTESERRRCTTAMESLLRRVGVELSPTATVQTTPVEFEALFPGTGGSLYGPRSKGARSVLARTGAATKVPGLYLAGGSVHPGSGVPMAALSGRLAAERIRADRALTGRSPSMATTGTTSMA
jgi:1-hydroxycarotenoid 3,4-desaturase